MLGNFLIGLREGLEAALVVSILVAFLVRTNRRDVLPKVWLGVGLAMAVSVGVTAALALTQQALTFEAQEAFGGSLSIIAVGFVTWMIFWMRRTARTISAELRGRLEDAIKMGPTAVVVMAALAVGREGLETALFFFTAAQAAGETTQPLIGFLLGIAVAIALAYLLYRGAVKINLSRFFMITGALLIFVAAGILAYGVHDLQEAAILPGLNTLAFDVSAAIPPDSWYGVLLKGVFNFSPQTTVLEAVVWVLYVAVVLTLFLRPQRTKTPVPANTRSRRLAMSRRIPRAGLAGAAVRRRRARRLHQHRAPSSAPGAPGPITVKAADTACEVSTTTAPAGKISFSINNTGTKTTEFYLYGAGDRIMGEVENIGPGLTRQLIVEVPDGGTYTTACKPGMVGDGIRAPFTVTGSAGRSTDENAKLAEATAGWKRYVTVAGRRARAQDAASSSTRSRRATSPAAKTLFPVARTYCERIEPVAESFGDLDPKLDGREDDERDPGAAWTGFHRLEKDLWVTGLQPDSGAIADQLVADIKDLQSRSPRR